MRENLLSWMKGRPYAPRYAVPIRQAMSCTNECFIGRVAFCEVKSPINEIPVVSTL